jgi:hypothetical protein
MMNFLPFNHRHIEPKARGFKFEDYFFDEVAPFLRSVGCIVEDRRGTDDDLKHGVDTIITHQETGSLKIDLCYRATTKLEDRKYRFSSLHTQGLVCFGMTERLRTGSINSVQLLLGAIRVWEDELDI